jgi:hypothetical protein
MRRIRTALTVAALALTATALTAQARVTYGMNGNGTYTGGGTADCNDGSTVSFTCGGIAGINPWQSGDFQSTPGSTGMGCAAAACEGAGGVDLFSVVFEIETKWEVEEAEAVREVLRFEP